MMYFLRIILQLNLISDIEVDIELPTGYLALRGIYIIGAWPVSRYPVSSRRKYSTELCCRAVRTDCSTFTSHVVSQYQMQTQILDSPRLPSINYLIIFSVFASDSPDPPTDSLITIILTDILTTNMSAAFSYSSYYLVLQLERIYKKFINSGLNKFS